MALVWDRRRFVLAAGGYSMLAASAPAYASPGTLIEKKESKYNTIYVYRNAGLVTMMFGVNRRLFTESVYNPADPRELPVAYTRYMTAALAYPRTLDSALEIGLGGGRTAAYLNKHMPALSLTSVELDPEVIAMAKKYFGLRESPTLTLVPKDGRLFLRQTKARYDLIMIDAYRGTFVPFHLLTREFFQTAKSRLKPGGVVAQNIEPTTMLYDGAIATLKAAFAQVDTFAAGGNVVAIAYDGPRRSDAELAKNAETLQARFGFRHPLPPLLAIRQAAPAGAGKVLTDDFAPVESLRATDRHNQRRGE